MCKKRIYFIKNRFIGENKTSDIHLGRCEIFLNTLKRIKFLEILEVDSIFDIEEKNKEDYIVFYPFFEFHSSKLDLFNKEHPILNKTIVIKTCDCHRGLDTGYLSINAHGISGSFLENPNNILGFGFVPCIRKNEINNIEFDNRINKFYFAGSSWNKREKFLITFFKKTDVEYHLYKNCNEEHLCFYNEEFKHFFNNHQNDQQDFYKSLRKHRFCLCPRGHGSTYRFLESMAHGCVTITEGVEEHFNKQYFVDGENYLSVGYNCEKIDEVLEVCKDTFLCNKIAKNGYECFMDNFALNENYALPFSTIMNILTNINKKYINFFDFRSYLL